MLERPRELAEHLRDEDGLGGVRGHASPRARFIASFTAVDVEGHLEEADLLLVHRRRRPAPSPRPRTCAARGVPTGPPPMDPPRRDRRHARSRRPPRPLPRRPRRASPRCPSSPSSSTIRLINAWFSGSMAPEAVQTKHSVRISITSAPRRPRHLGDRFAGHAVALAERDHLLAFEFHLVRPHLLRRPSVLFTQMLRHRGPRAGAPSSSRTIAASICSASWRRCREPLDLARRRAA